MASAERSISASSSVSSRPVRSLIAWKKRAPISRGKRRRLGICNTHLRMTSASWPRSRTSSLLTLGTVPSRNCLSSGVTRTSSPKSNEHRHSVQWKGRPSYIRYICERKECRSRTAGFCRTKPFSRCVSDWRVRVGPSHSRTIHRHASRDGSGRFAIADDSIVNHCPPFDCFGAASMSSAKGKVPAPS